MSTVKPARSMRNSTKLSGISTSRISFIMPSASTLFLLPGGQGAQGAGVLRQVRTQGRQPVALLLGIQQVGRQHRIPVEALRRFAARSGPAGAAAPFRRGRRRVRVLHVLRQRGQHLRRIQPGVQQIAAQGDRAFPPVPGQGNLRDPSPDRPQGAVLLCHSSARQMISFPAESAGSKSMAGSLARPPSSSARSGARPAGG